MTPGEPRVPTGSAAAAKVGSGEALRRDAGWQEAARRARLLAWASLAWMGGEGALGLWAGYRAGSAALVGWAFGSAIEAAASLIVVWRFTGTRTASDTAERRAQRAVAVSFWLLAPYIAAEAVRELTGAGHAETTSVGLAVTAASLLVMPTLGRAKHRLGARLGSAATAGEGTQNYLCAAQAAAVLVALAVVAAWPAAWPVDAIVGLAIAAWAVWEGVEAWQGDECC